MKYGIETLTCDVMARLGEFPRPQSSLEDTALSEGIPWPEEIIAMRIRSLLPEAGAELIMKALGPPEGGVAVDPPPSGVRGDLRGASGLYFVEVRLPEDFLRLESVKMGEWRHAVSEAVTSGDSGWERQWSAEPGIAGCPERPRVYLDRDAGGGVLRLMGSRSAEDDVEWLKIWRIPTPDSDGRFDFPAPLYSALVSSIVATF